MFSPDLVQKIRKAYSRTKNYRKVGKAFSMGPSSAWYVVKTDYNRPKKKRGPKKRITTRQKGRILHEVKRLNAKSEKVTARKIKTNCDISLSIRTLQRELKSLNLTYKKAEKKLELGPQHHEARIKFATEHLENP